MPQIEQEQDDDSDLNLSDYEIEETDHYVPKIPKQHNSNLMIFEPSNQENRRKRQENFQNLQDELIEFINYDMEQLY